jgi:RimJ/RimL family protein N-acetyltransferase
MTHLRIATMNDADDLFAWRNDAETLAWSRSTEPVARDDHQRWMEFNVQYGYPAHMVMIAENDLGSLGVVRFDADRSDGMVYKTSITIAPKHRGQGHSLEILSQACAYMHESILDAEIRRDNLRSRKIFAQCGFELAEVSSDFVHYRREPLS